MLSQTPGPRGVRDGCGIGNRRSCERCSRSRMALQPRRLPRSLRLRARASPCSSRTTGRSRARTGVVDHRLYVAVLASQIQFEQHVVAIPHEVLARRDVQAGVAVDAVAVAHHAGKVRGPQPRRGTCRCAPRCSGRRCPERLVRPGPEVEQHHRQVSMPKRRATSAAAHLWAIQKRRLGRCRTRRGCAARWPGTAR